MTHQFEVGITQQMGNVVLGAAIKVIEAQEHRSLH